MKQHKGYSRVAVLALMAVTLGCQTPRSAQEGTLVKPQAQPVEPRTAVITQEQSAAPKVILKDEKDKSSYSVGFELGKDLQVQELGLNLEPLLQGIRDSVLRNKPLLSPDELTAVRFAFLRERLEARAEALGPEAEKNLMEGEVFLRDNAKKEGVKTLPSGLQYRVLQQGTGPVPGVKDNVRIHYVVKTVDGKVLLSTYEVGQPTVVPVKGMLPAWTEALQLMKVGEKWEIAAPSYLAYGERGADGVVQPFQALIFDIELIGIQYADPH